jgi:hypothetical protein
VRRDLDFFTCKNLARAVTSRLRESLRLVSRQNAIRVRIKTIRENSCGNQACLESSEYGASSVSRDCVPRRRGQRKRNSTYAWSPGPSRVMSGGSVVAVMQPTQSRLRNRSAPISGLNSPNRSLLSQAEMGTVFMVVADVFRKQSLEMAFVRRNDVVQ